MFCVFADIHLCVAGELPKELGKLVNLTMLLLSSNQFEGELYVPADMYCVFADIHLCVAGELPKELGNLVNLKVLELQRNGVTGTIVCPNIHAMYVLLTFPLLQESCPRSSATSSI